MSLNEFIERNQAGIDAVIKTEMSDLDYPIDFEKRVQWVVSFDTLYQWALDEGVEF